MSPVSSAQSILNPTGLKTDFAVIKPTKLMTRIRLVWLISAMFTIGNSIKLRRLTAGICPELFGLRLRERMTDANELPIAVSVVAARNEQQKRATELNENHTQEYD